MGPDANIATTLIRPKTGRECVSSGYVGGCSLLQSVPKGRAQQSKLEERIIIR